MDEVASDKSQSNDKVLRRSIAAYRGHLTRIYRELEPLLCEPCCEEAIIKRETLDKAFNSYKEASQNYLQCTTISYEDGKAMADQIHEETKRYNQFSAVYSDWLRNLNLNPTNIDRQDAANVQLDRSTDEFIVT